MAEYEKKVRQILKEYNCYFVRHGKGDHDIWYSPISNRNFTVDGKINIRHNTMFTEKINRRIKSLDEGKCIVKTLAELEALADE